MTTERYLSQLRNIDRRIEDKLYQVQKWEDMAIGLGSPTMEKDKVQTSRKLDKMSTAMVNLVDSKKEYEEKLSTLTELKKTIIAQIDTMDGVYYDILSAIYIHGLDTPEIAWELKVSTKTIKRKKKEALEIFEKQYGSQYISTKF